MDFLKNAAENAVGQEIKDKVGGEAEQVAEDKLGGFVGADMAKNIVGGVGSALGIQNNQGQAADQQQASQGDSSSDDSQQ